MKYGEIESGKLEIQAVIIMALAALIIGTTLGILIGMPRRYHFEESYDFNLPVTILTGIVIITLAAGTMIATFIITNGGTIVYGTANLMNIDSIIIFALLALLLGMIMGILLGKPRSSSIGINYRKSRDLHSTVLQTEPQKANNNGALVSSPITISGGESASALDETTNSISPSKDASKQSIEIFYSYSHKDERFKKRLETQLGLLKQQGYIVNWSDRKIEAGQEWKSKVNHHLNTANIILLLVSPDFLASDYCYSVEMTRALERHNRGEAHIIPVILRQVYWQDTPFGALQALPDDAKPIASSSWHNQDEAFFNVAEGIRKIVEGMRSYA